MRRSQIHSLGEKEVCEIARKKSPQASQVQSHFRVFENSKSFEYIDQGLKDSHLVQIGFSKTIGKVLKKIVIVKWGCIVKTMMCSIKYGHFKGQKWECQNDSWPFKWCFEKLKQFLIEDLDTMFGKVFPKVKR